MILYVFLFFLFLLFPSSVSAAKPSVSGIPSTVDVTQSFQVNITLTIATSAGKNYYLRAVFFKPNTTQYFGYTKNHFDSWYNGTPSPIDPLQFKKVTMDAYNTWSGVVEVKPDPDKGAGSYSFKLGYYRETGGSIADWSDAVQIEITGSSASPTPTPSPSPSPSPTPDSSPSPSPSPKPSLSPKPSITLSPKVLGTAKTATPSPSPVPTPTQKEDKLVLGQTTTASPRPQAQPTSRFGGNTYLAFGLMGLGLILIIFSAYTFLKPKPSDTITIDS